MRAGMRVEALESESTLRRRASFSVLYSNGSSGPFAIKVTIPGMHEIAIVGAGPAGAMCGERLASAGFGVTIFDERLAWEKPCGGGLTHKAVETYPFLLDNPHPKKIVRTAELISSRGHRARFELDHPIVIYSRKVLNGLLLDRAITAGCRAVHSRVTRVDTGGERVGVHAGTEIHHADFVVLAGGARNQLLPDTTALGSDDLEMTLGYFVPTEENILKVKFLRKFEGYLWSFPRDRHLSVGICGKLKDGRSHVLRQHLDTFIQEEGIPMAGAELYSHVLPSPQPHTLRQRRIAGKDWAMAGDAAACVDPITGEGLYYALRSGDLLAQALIADQPESYPEELQAEFSADLEFAARIARKVFKGTFFGAAITTRVVQLVRYSPTFRDLIRDIFSGAQNYRGLKRRLWQQFGITMAEFGESLLDPRRALPSHHSVDDREAAQ
jgi:flavin-dependent dehydrogenase